MRTTRSTPRCDNSDMTRVALVVWLAFVSAIAAAATPDYAREERWAKEVVPQIVAGDALWLTIPERPRVLAIFTEPPGLAKGAVIVVHGLGVHPDWSLIGDLRTKLADRGYATLAVQMPVLAADAPRDAYRDLFDDAGARIAAALSWLHAKGYAKVAIVSHSMGASMTDAFLARSGAATIAAWVPVGMLVDFTQPPRMPVLDVVAERDFPDALDAAKSRAAGLARNACSKGMSIAQTDHYMNGATSALAEAIRGFLDRVFAGKCGEAPPP